MGRIRSMTSTPSEPRFTSSSPARRRFTAGMSSIRSSKCRRRRLASASASRASMCRRHRSGKWPSCAVCRRSARIVRRARSRFWICSACARATCPRHCLTRFVMVVPLPAWSFHRRIRVTRCPRPPHCRFRLTPASARARSPSPPPRLSSPCCPELRARSISRAPSAASRLKPPPNPEPARMAALRTSQLSRGKSSPRPPSSFWAVQALIWP